MPAWGTNLTTFWKGKIRVAIGEKFMDLVAVTVFLLRFPSLHGIQAMDGSPAEIFGYCHQ